MLLTLGPDSGLGDAGHVLGGGLFQQPQIPWSDLEVEDPYTAFLGNEDDNAKRLFSHGIAGSGWPLCRLHWLACAL